MRIRRESVYIHCLISCMPLINVDGSTMKVAVSILNKGFLCGPVNVDHYGSMSCVLQGRLSR